MKLKFLILHYHTGKMENELMNHLVSVYSRRKKSSCLVVVELYTVKNDVLY